MKNCFIRRIAIKFAKNQKPTIGEGATAQTCSGLCYYRCFMLVREVQGRARLMVKGCVKITFSILLARRLNTLGAGVTQGQLRE